MEVMYSSTYGPLQLCYWIPYPPINAKLDGGGEPWSHVGHLTSFAIPGILMF